MKIKRLILTSFGKFKDKTIEISDGFNLLYGENEAGKSTVQAFIEGVFFGFYKPYRKKRIYSEDFERFRPWNNSSYCGAIIYEDENGHDIRVERDFLKKQDGVKIYNNITGKDITSEYAYDYVTRQAQPLSRYQINQVIYNNTVNVRQRAGASDDDMARELNDRLLEVGTSDSDGISIGRVIRQMEERKKAIGSYGQSRSDYGKAVRELENLESALEESEHICEEVRKNQQLIQKYRKKIDDLNAQCDDASAKKQARTEKGLKAMEEKVAGIREEGDALRQRLDELRPYENYDVRVYGRLKILQNSIEQADSQIVSLEKQIADAKAEIETMDHRRNQIENNLKGLSQREVNEDYERYCALKKDGTPTTDSKKSIFNLPFDLPDNALIALIIFGALLIGTVFINPGGMINQIIQFILAFIGWVLVIGGVSMMLSHNKSESVSNVTTDAIDILKKYSRKNEKDYFEFVKKAMDIFDGLDNLESDKEKVKNKLSTDEQNLANLKESRLDYQHDLESELKLAGVESVEAYNRGCEMKNEYERVRAAVEGNERLYDALSDGSMIQVESEESDNPVVMTTPEGEPIHAREAILAFSDEISRLQGENNMLTRSMQSPVELGERIETLKKDIAGYEEDMEAYDIAIAALERLSETAHSDSAPKLNEKVGSILEQITHKYKEVKIDENLNVRIVNPQGNDLIGIDQLSGGTMDQIYLALRFGIGDVMQISENLPFILDDPFVQYDYTRKAEALLYLYALSKGHQVLLFTCSSDEKRILDDNHLSYRGMILS